MTIFTFILFVALIGTVFSMILAIKGNYKLYWVAAVALYIFSIITGFSIGQLTVGLVFIPLSLAIGYSFKLIQNRIQVALFLTIGLAIGVIMVLYIDDAWLFFPALFG